MRAPSSYIQAARILDAPAKFPWKGTGMHFGPSQGTKLHEVFGKLTTCGLTTVCAMVEEWLVWRLHASVDVDLLLDQIDATLAWEFDRCYRDLSSLRLQKKTPAEQAIGDGVWMVQLLTEDDKWTGGLVAIDKAAALVSITRQTLDDKPKRAFNTWLDFAIGRAAKLEPRPKRKKPAYSDFDSKEEYIEATRPYFGQPFPREALNPDIDYEPEDRERYLSRFLEGLDWKKNSFLRPPADMKKLGFKGTPYKL